MCPATNQSPSRARWSRALWVAGGIVFVLVATANGAGYRYGVSDQAFYIPVVTRALDPAAFPHDASLIDGQGRLILVDELIAALARTTGASLDILYFAGYLFSLALVWVGLTLIGASLYQSPWTTIALAAALTLRHRIPRTSANSLEPYFHPRMLAFGLGLVAIAALFRRRFWAAIVLVGVAALIHITTALWFAVLIGVALAVLDRTMRRMAFVTMAFVAAAAAWLMTSGPLRASMTSMDGVWLQALASKDSLFPSAWPLWAWAANLGLLLVLWWSHVVRCRAPTEGGLPAEAGSYGGPRTADEERALVWGATALVAIFLITLPAVTAGRALAVQLQISRIFWLVDVLAIVYLLALVDRRRIVRLVAVLLVGFSVARGLYVMLVERPERALFSIHIVDSPWEDAMRWIARQPVGVNVLADPGHSWKYGTSVRVSAGRDVFLEDVKDSAIAIYSRDVAARVVERAAAVGDFTHLTPERATELARRYDLDFLVTEADLPLPLAYRNQQFRIYSLSSTR